MDGDRRREAAGVDAVERRQIRQECVKYLIIIANANRHEGKPPGREDAMGINRERVATRSPAVDG
jgi:hypothetical protein